MPNALRAEVSFEYLEEIGQHGQNSRTFRTKDHQLDAEIVVKEIPKAKLDAGRFFAEAQALYASAHPNVVQIHYSCENADSVFVAMPLYGRGSLKGLMSQRHLTLRETITLGCQVSAGLHHVHSKKLVHFDVKPDNVLLSSRSEALLSDFGLARPLGPAGVAEQDRWYVRCQPPEIYTQYEFSRSFDIYQLGLLLYRMTNGDEEFDRQFEAFQPGGVFDRNAFRVAVVNGQFPDRSKFPAHIPEKIRATIRRCLNVDPAMRFSSALDVANELAQVEGDRLDWQMSQVGDCIRWERNVTGTQYEFEWAPNGSTVCYKTVNGGQRRRHGSGCQAKMTDRAVRTFLGEL